MNEITRQHLEDAARAAGIALEWDGDPAEWQPMYYEGKTYHTWEPDTDDGDSRRLQIAVRMSLVVGGSSAAAGLGLHHARLVRHDGTPDDAARAAREAVVLCAAEVGKRMREGER